MCRMERETAIGAIRPVVLGVRFDVLLTLINCMRSLLTLIQCDMLRHFEWFLSSKSFSMLPKPSTIFCLFVMSACIGHCIHSHFGFSLERTNQAAMVDQVFRTISTECYCLVFKVRSFNFFLLLKLWHYLDAFKYASCLAAATAVRPRNTPR